MRAALTLLLRLTAACALLLLFTCTPAPVHAATVTGCTNLCTTCGTASGRPFCQQCRDGYVPDHFTYQCSLKPSWPTPCNVSNCVQCVLNNQDQCYTCAEGYLPVAQTFQCQSAAPGPQPAPPAPPSNSTSTTTTAKPCSVLWCDTCDANNTSVCKQCSTGFVLTSANKCEAAGSCFVPGCAACAAGNSSNCTSCRAGFELISPTSCKNTVSTSGAAVIGSPVWPAAVLGATLLLLVLAGA